MREKQPKSQVRAGMALSFLLQPVQIVIGFVYAAVLIRRLGAGEYGLYEIVASFLAYIGVVQDSLSSGVLRFYCTTRTQGDARKTSSLLAVCRRIFRAFSGVTLVLSGVVILLFRMFYQTSMTPHELTEGSWMLALLFLNLVITLQASIYNAVIVGNERFVFLKGLDLLSRVLRLATVALLLWSYPHAFMVTLVQVVMNLVYAVCEYLYARRVLGMEIKLYQHDTKLYKDILTFSTGILLASIADQIFWKTDQVILGRLYDTSVAAISAIGAQIYQHYMVVGTAVSSVFFSRVSELYQQPDGTSRISKLFIRVGRLSFLICFAVLSGFAAFGREFISLWAGEAYLSAYAIALVVMLPFTVDIIQNLGLTILKVTNQYPFRAKLYLVTALLNIPLSVVLAMRWQGFGAAMSTGLSMLLTSGFVMNWYYRARVGLDIAGFWRNITGILLRLLPLAAAACALNAWLPPTHGLLPLAGKIVLYLACYLWCAYRFALNADEKEQARQVMRRLCSFGAKK